MSFWRSNERGSDEPISGLYYSNEDRERYEKRLKIRLKSALKNIFSCIDLCKGSVDNILK